MGLDVTRSYKGLFSYEDRHGEIVYRNLGPMFIREEDDHHDTDRIGTPLVGIYTKGPGQEEYQYAGHVSEFYKFIGNEELNRRVRESIASVGMPILEENTILWDSYCRMRNEIIIQSSQATRQAGDVLPVMIVNNSYNGTRAATLAFGIAIDNSLRSANRTIFGFNLGEMRQIHIAASTTQLTSAVGTYMQVFTQDISDMITQSFNSQLNADEMLAVLDVIEGIGKNRAKKISEILASINPQPEDDGPPRLPSAWQVFLAIARYSSLEPNLNAKRLLENAAESVLVIPPRMFEVLDQLQSS